MISVLTETIEGEIQSRAAEVDASWRENFSG